MWGEPILSWLGMRNINNPPSPLTRPGIGRTPGANPFLQNMKDKKYTLTGVFYLSWLGMRDSNPRMVGPEPTALPLGESPTVVYIITLLRDFAKILAAEPAEP